MFIKQKNMMVNEKIKTIFKLVLSQIAEVFPYVLGVYIVCLIISYFFERWKLFFNWPVFHSSVIILGVLSLLSKKGKRFLFFLIQRRLIREKFINSIVKFKLFEIKPRNLVIFVFARIRKLSEISYIKIGFIIIILAYSLYKGLNLIDFLVFSYALVSIAFILESRIAAVIALLFLISCPVLLILKKAPFAEAMAVYAYYFLIITVATQLREYCRKERPKKVIHS
ncbi:hypothetical protein COS21_01390 [bacterium (Candidatus Gribaldobacteria) CG02_land_8_20_14_3_00_41_15]|uniref:Uncharacterized protein n=2 Tax=Candidatus Gribaldobacteria TaxID=2798536 RepID=A0A2M7DE97_9BACT|nr:MAG: hypothetical protein COS21_01390 [bacterium (Candidatus Gribaldobacteria) CG02_land_8_20_14_3_00_41_15]